jgi:plasmid stability protein
MEAPVMAGRKRRSGRKPGGEFPNKTATFTTRLQRETRRALNAAAEANGRSVSAEAEYLLKTALKKPSGPPRNQALAAAIALLAANIEDGTKENWLDDQFTGMALRYAIEHLLWHFGPTPTLDGNRVAPAAIDAQATKMPPEFAQQFRKPAGFGRIVADRLISEIEASGASKINEWSLPIFLSGADPRKLQLINRDLRSADGKKGK